MRGQDFALAHVGDVAAVALVEADQHAALLGYMANRQAGAAAVSPRRPMNRRVEVGGREFADMPQIVLEQPLLGGHLCVGVKMLRAATAADAEVRATRPHARRRFVQDRQAARLLVGGLATVDGVFDAFARQGAGDEHRLALEGRDAASLVVQRGNDSDGHAMLSQK